jgi:hypothetical protein
MITGTVVIESFSCHQERDRVTAQERRMTHDDGGRPVAHVGGLPCTGSLGIVLLGRLKRTADPARRKNID